MKAVFHGHKAESRVEDLRMRGQARLYICLYMLTGRVTLNGPLYNVTEMKLVRSVHSIHDNLCSGVFLHQFVLINIRISMLI